MLDLSGNTRILRREVLSLLAAEREAHDYQEWFARGLFPRPRALSRLSRRI